VRPGGDTADADLPTNQSRARPWLVGTTCALLVVLVASVAGWLPVQLMRVGSDSMAPTVPTGSLVLIVHGPTGVERMDVVAVEPVDGQGPLLVKRAVAVGGDEIAIEDGVLVVNGRPVCEPEIDPALIDGQYFGPATVPPGQVFLLGDNRASSIDSRTFGTVPVEDVRGRLEWRLLPAPGRPSLGGAGC
jgi:signal peptidase I